MRDVVFLVLVLGFFVGASAYVRGCAALVGSATDTGGERAELAEDEEAAA